MTLPSLFQPKYLFALVLGLYCFFGSLHLTEFITADEHYWVYERIPQYWEGWTSGKLRKTFINDKPGVSLALISGPALLLFPHPEDVCAEKKDRTYDCHTAVIEKLLLAFRLPLLIFNGLILLYLFWIIGKLTTPWIALWSVSFIGLSPPLLGITQIVNPDALLWSTSAAALFSFYAMLKYGTRSLILWTIFFTTLALLSKYTALILFPFYVFLILSHFLIRSDLSPSESLVTALKKDLLHLLLVSFGIIAFVSLVLPALYVDQKYLGEYLMTVPDKEVLVFFSAPLLLLLMIDVFLLRAKLLLKLRAIVTKHFFLLRSLPFLLLALLVLVCVSRLLFPDWSLFRLPFDLKDLSDARYHAEVPDALSAFFLEWNPLFFSLTPAALIALIALWIEGVRKTRPSYYYFSLSLGIFLLFFTIILVASNVLATPRYIILLYPLLGFLAGLGISQISEWCEVHGKSFKASLSLMVIAGSIASLVAIQPFYFNYSNFLLPKKYLIQDGWGLGGFEAAQYLNSLPEADKLTVWSDYYGVCEFFVGTCLTAYTFDGTLIKPDYYVLTRRGEIRYMSRYTRWERLSGLTAYKYYRAPDPVWELIIDERPANFVKVVKVTE